ncbi:bifunctional metallophosphatase/5'-nucleotidase [Xylanibacillus composti]|uniref:Putative metallophosphoesterase YunD n=1 Tax=Xylanibacillus composti TaxID=1572762 RepID=A0A8J4H2S3_9BACL|nr:bifunctional UDP-sugar hydrolase/5'-nucleotidase [Xylanibacillus composti]MDT9724764.1 bifunctional metallophosphatase/5'-nucleotidase [Xylanibacillus composti]GIQ69883.1 putative metallophosphoesterase YunD [Xylanibacillus composti]
MKTLHVKIVHTNDIHSHLENAARAASAIRAIRREHEQDGILLMDIGDHMDRMRLETEGTDGRCNIAMMNAIGYEVFVPGNNEGLTFTKGELYMLSRQAQFPIVAGNMRELESGKLPDWIKPYVVIEKAGVTIGIIGVTVNFNAFYNLLGWDIGEPLACVREWAAQLRPHVDVLVVCSHLGLGRDEQMAAEIPGIDCILGGHTHHLLEEPLLVGSTRIFAAGKLGAYVGEIDIQVDRETRQLVIEGRCIAVENYAPDPEIVDLIQVHRTAAKQAMGQTAAVADRDLRISWTEESPLANLLAAGLRRWTNADVGIVNAGQLLRNVEKGGISREMLHECCPSPINPCRMTLTGAAIRQALEESLLEDRIHIPIRGFGFRGKELGVLAVDGATVYYDPTRPSYEKIVRVEIQGRPMEADQTYSVGTIDMFSFGIGYLSLKGGGEIRYWLPEFIRDVLCSQLNEPSEVERSERSRWRNVHEIKEMGTSIPDTGG